MDLFCEKYSETVPEAETVCRRPDEYCKFRSACIVHFLGREHDRSGSVQGGATGQEKETLGVGVNGHENRWILNQKKHK
ncbi:MAG: RNA polymerase II-associated protein [Desulfobulbaceae bacterium]|nr:MAG: RNA polymerase II-associated protein [Desulfobulbaceae bacterium]